MNKLLIGVLALATILDGQNLANSGPTNVTVNSATVGTSLTASQTAPIAAIEFTVPSGTLAPSPGPNLGTKTLVCTVPGANGIMLVKCLIYGFDDVPIPTSVLLTYPVIATGIYSVANVVGASPAGDEVPVTVSGPLAVNLLFSRCDVNHDRVLSQADQDLLVSYWRGTPIPSGVVVDIDKSGKFNSADIQRLGRIIRGLALCPE